jgi:ATP-dependent DNA helicase RecG
MITDVLVLTERIKNSIQLGESHFREFKSAWQGRPDDKQKGDITKLCRYIGEALVAFANADGGDLLIGVEDDGCITGIPHSESNIKTMLQATKTHIHANNPLPLSIATKIEIDNKLVLFFSVDKGVTEIYQLPDGRCVKRKDMETVPITFKEITSERQERKSREYDRQFVDGATVNDLDREQLQAIADGYLKGISIERYLQQVGLAEYGTTQVRLKMAALLLFAKDIQKWHPRSQIRILRISGTELKSGHEYNVISDEIISGNIFNLIINSWERLRSFLASKTEFDGKFEQKFTYPEDACREALINAITHRDYNIQNGIDIFIYTDRIEIKNPGALLSTLTVKDLEELQGAHESRNVNIAKILRENRYVRELGEGMRRMFMLMQTSELQPPKLYSNTTWFSVTFYRKSSFTQKEEQWLSCFESYNLDAKLKRLVILGMNDRKISADDIYKALGTEELREYSDVTTVLVKAGIFESICSNSQVYQESKRKGIPKRQVPRFIVRLPTDN